MNMQSMMQQAQRMQNEIMKKKAEIDKTEFSGTSELVDIIVYGNKTIKLVNIKNKESISLEDLEAIEDMVTIAFNDAIKKIDFETNTKLGQYGSALNGLI